MAAARTAAIAAAVVLAAAAAAGAAPDPQAAGLQVALRAHGLYRGPVDGLVGPRTVAAVRRFQARAGLAVDGLAGPATRRALGPLGRPLFGKRQIGRGMVGWDVSVLQFLLRRAGFPPGGIDGVFGPGTHGAVRRLQHARGLAADGLVGPATRRALLGKRSVRSAAPRVRRVRYLVRPGDTLTAIAVRFGTTVAAVARANRLDPVGILPAGAVLSVPVSHAAGDVPALLDRVADRYGVSRELVRALAWQESGFQPHVVSPAGARGVMQVTPSAWEFVEIVLLGRRVPTTTAGNVEVGVAYLAHLLRRFGGDPRLAVGAYYQGERSVRRHGLFAETEQYVANVLALRGRV